MKKNLQILVMLLLLIQGITLEARQPYQAVLTVDAESAKVTAPNLVDLNRDLKSHAIESLIPIYTPVSPISIDVNLRGIQALASFAADSTTLLVEIPDTGDTESFTGATRDDSLILFKDYIRDGGHRHKILKAYARYSPIDPIAGNPNSLMATMAQSDYALSQLAPLTGCNCRWAAQPITHQFQAGANMGRSFSESFDTTTVTAPLRYSYSPDLNSALIIDAPITYNRNDGASSIFGSIGLGLRLPLTSNWALTSTLRGGAGGSLDLCTSGSFISCGFSSVYNYKISNYVFSMTNYIGYFSSTNLWLTGINFNYNLHNYVIKNGFLITLCESMILCNRQMNFSFSFIDTCFTREKLFIRHYEEICFSLISTALNSGLNGESLTMGFSYQYGQKKYKGYFLNIIYQF